MKPKPFSALNHFTVPCATCAPTFMRRTTPLDRGAGFLLFRPSERTWNSNRAERYNKKARKTGTPRGIDTGPCPEVSADQTGFARRLQRRAHAVRGSDDRLQRVQRLQALTGVEDDGLL